MIYLCFELPNGKIRDENGSDEELLYSTIFYDTMICLLIEKYSKLSSSISKQKINKMIEQIINFEDDFVNLNIFFRLFNYLHDNPNKPNNDDQGFFIENVGKINKKIHNEDFTIKIDESSQEAFLKELREKVLKKSSSLLKDYKSVINFEA